MAIVRERCNLAANAATDANQMSSKVRRAVRFIDNNVEPTLTPETGVARAVAAPLPSINEMGESDHFVHFYENESFLVESVSEFIGAALQSEEPAIVIATAAHRDSIDECLEKKGVDIVAARAREQYVTLDAAETLSAFMVNDAPDAERFRNAVGTVISGAARGGKRVRAFGEMVALLWAEGNGAAAIRLEQLWNELGKELRFSLFCAYPMVGFQSASNGEPFIHICEEHSKVLPAESYPRDADVDARLRFISLLQQKANSLEAEIAERKRAECALREEQTRLEVAVAVAQLGIWELDILTNVLTCSNECKAHFGLAPTDPVNYERFFEMVYPDDREAVKRALRAAVETSSDYAIEYRIIDPAGRLRWISSMARCFHNGSHRILGVTLDNTTRMQVAEVLEQTVTERTAELHETIGELEAFSYSISHDMRAPLRSMQGFAQILLQECGDKLDPECRSYLDRITSAAERMDRLIQDVLTFSRVARTELNLEPINLNHLLRGILECYPNLQAPQAEIVIEGRLPVVLGNAAALTQCLSNLLGNAVKFVARGTLPRVSVWAELRRVPASNSSAKHSAHPKGPMVRLSINDNGIGIPKEGHDKIFAIFQRLSKNYEGTGIGLAIVKKAAERMGGRVGVDSEPGKGSTFWLDLMAAEPANG